MRARGRELAAADWPITLMTLMRQWDGYQTGLIQSRKREMLARVIDVGVHLEQLAVKVANLAKSWGSQQAPPLWPNRRRRKPSSRKARLQPHKNPSPANPRSI